MKLPKAPDLYDVGDQARLRAEIEKNDLRVLKTGADVALVSGERLFQTAAHGITAHAGGGQGSAVALTARINHVGTVATAADSLALMPALAGLSQTLINRGANAAQVFGQGADTVNGAAAATGVSQAANTVVTYYCPQNGTWYG